MDEKVVIEVRAPTVEEAIECGLEELDADRDEVEVEVLQEGSRGVLGLGAKEACVRLTLVTEVSEENEAGEDEYSQERLERVAKATLEELLERMRVKAQVVVRSDVEMETSSEEDTPPVVLDVLGDDLGVLIGRRGETLAALQYITRLIVSREMQRWVNLVVDVERYKVRRERILRQLAERMAEQVALTHQPMALEPMPPHERRIVHIALRDHPIVTTQSVGRGDSRKVTIIPRR
ncbi:MAG: protein jag [Anaerolineae bacterium]|jgi:spoIIIJ-associated protein|nr:protein jag [Anaerolineae bacterium]MDH7474280.1 RNA-binding cell elongation regulator Jag/EloR [Anaerolineae bacterium]